MHADWSRYFHCWATRPIAPGSELLVPYGGRQTRMKNSALLTEYGFTLDPDGDPDTVAALEPEVGVIEIPTLGGKRFDLLRSLNHVGVRPTSTFSLATHVLIHI